MNWTLPSVRSPKHIAIATTVIVFGVSLGIPAGAQTAAPAGQPAPATVAARQAIEARKAAYALIGRNFRPLGDILKGTVKYDDADVEKGIARIAFLAGLVNEEFPESSNLGEPDTKAKPDIWSNRADFDKRLRELQLHIAALAEVNATDKAPSEAFKAAVTTLGQDCKGCHDTYKLK
jgi:cytochrome c556